MLAVYIVPRGYQINHYILIILPRYWFFLKWNSYWSFLLKYFEADAKNKKLQKLEKKMDKITKEKKHSGKAKDSELEAMHKAIANRE